jgi:hypothetical protein
LQADAALDGGKRQRMFKIFIKRQEHASCHFYEMRFVVLLLLSMWLLPADAQTKLILKQQLLNMAQ